MLRSEFWRRFDFWLLGAVVIATVFGVTMIRSAIAGNETLANLVPRQITWSSLGFVVILVMAAIDYRFWASAIRWIYIAIMIFLVILFGTAQARFGATRWIETGIVSIQPTELAKIVVVLSLAHFFATTVDQPRGWRWLILSLLIPAGLAVWIFLQPNLSNVIVIAALWGAMAWVGKLPLKQIGAIIIVVVVVAVVAWPSLEIYQRDRIVNFLFPDPTARHGATYNVDQALIALGSGGWLGKGYGLGPETQLRFMKVRHTDFIFSVIGEEFGIVGAVLVITLLGFIIYRCLRAANLARDPFGRFIAYGVAILIFFQGAVNIAVNLNIVPVSGLPLPFISYGGSGLLSLMLGIGLVESVALRSKPLDF